MRRLFAEPLTWFLLVGVLLFLAQVLVSELARPRIVVDRAAIDVLIRQREAQYMRVLSAAERESVADEWLADEILYREAYRRGLDRDERIRRALILKMRSEITGELAAPSEDALRVWFDGHRDRYVGPDGRPADYETVRSYLRGDWLMDQSRQAIRAEVARLKAAYEIVPEAG